MDLIQVYSRQAKPKRTKEATRVVSQYNAVVIKIPQPHTLSDAPGVNSNHPIPFVINCTGNQREDTANGKDAEAHNCRQFEHVFWGC